MRRLAALSAIPLIGLGAVACGGSSKVSTATACQNISKDGQQAASALNSISETNVTSSDLDAFHTLANVLTNDTNNASDSSFKAAADKFASDLNKFADDAKAQNKDAVQADLPSIQTDVTSLEKYCPST